MNAEFNKGILLQNILMKLQGAADFFSKASDDRNDAYGFFEEARDSAVTLKEYLPKNKKVKELATLLTTAVTALDKSFTLDDKEKNCSEPEEQNSLVAEREKECATISHCLDRSEQLAEEINNQHLKKPRTR